ncbi:MAG TPA: hypothetical protein VFP84_12760 [Kofleriaceae bacterium]|nr:hypothetical protein [Kofleriaceae bacterium]
MVSLCGVGCVDGFRGANVQVDLSPGTPAQAHYATTLPGGPAPTAGAEVPANTHYTLFAVQDGAMASHLFAVQDFEIHHIVDLSSPCFIDQGEHVPYPGIHVSQFAAKVAADTKITDPANPPASATTEQKIQYATAQQRMLNVNALAGTARPGVNAVVSASAAAYPAIAADCNGPDTQLPPPQCFDAASNARRLKLCQAAWNANPSLWEGSDRVLTEPLHGTTYGLVDGQNPISQGPVGGAQFFVDNALTAIDGYAIYLMPDGGPAEPTGAPLYFGRPSPTATRGVVHVHLVNPDNPALTSEMAVFIDLGHDDVHF